MNKLKLHTPDFTNANIGKIAELFPHCATESTDDNGNPKLAIDFDLLKQELSSSLVDGTQERYQLNWVGKREALLTANAPIAKTLRPCRAESVDFDNTKNLYIEGDNLDALKLLQETYLNQVKMIYIDPPYNTGNDFIYPDDFAEDTESYKLRSNQKDEDGNRLVENTESNGRFHSDWLSMMYSRLKLARNLLRDDGVIFISIDDNEQANLKRLCDEVFGEDNYINNICVKAKPSAGASGGGEDKRLKKNTEFLLLYVKSKDAEGLDLNQAFEEIDLFEHIEKMEQEKKSWKYTRFVQSFGNKKYIKSVVDGDGNEIKIYEHNNYKFVSLSEYLKDGFSRNDFYLKQFETVFRDTNAQSSIRTRVMDAIGEIDGLFSIEYIPRSGKSKGKSTVVYYKGNNKDQLAWLKDIARFDNKNVSIRGKIGTLWLNFNWNNVSKEGDTLFPNGKKPIAFIQRMLSISTKPYEEQIVLDFFSGSGSTAHAVMQLNAEDGGKRKFIMVQIPEPCDEKSEAFKAGYKAITEIGKERIRRAGQKIKTENSDKENIAQLDIGFRVLKIDSSNMNDVYYSPDSTNQKDLLNLIDNICPDRSDEDLLFQVLLDWGVDLTLPIQQEKIDEKTVLTVADNEIVACFDRQGGISEDFIKKLTAKQPKRVVFCDSGFADDSVKINVEQVFKSLSPHTDIKTI
ncbi:MAG: site-specific DNA-methyltransferase [Phycisphaerae bacterium]|nr:site-specific DNA-methyltransferase [Phycisphaerae bacterium]